MLEVFLFGTFVLFFGSMLILASFQEENRREGLVYFVLGVLIIIASTMLFKYVFNQINKKEKILLTYIIDNNLTNKKIEKEFKNEIFEIEKERAVKKIKKELKFK